MNREPIRCAARIAAALGAASLALAITGNVQVEVTDAQGNPIEGAKVSLLLPGGGSGAVAATDAGGLAIVGGDEGQATLVVEHEGQRKEIAVTVPGGGTLRQRVRLPIGSGPPADDDGPQRFVRFRAGLAQVGVPSQSGAIGTLIRTNEVGFVLSPRRLSGPALEFEVDPGWSPSIGSSAWSWTLGAQYKDADDSESRSVAPGTTPVALTYWQPAPNASTGLGLGATGADGFVMNCYRYFGFRATLSRNRPGRGRTQPYFGVAYGHLTEEIAGAFTSPTFTGASEISATIDQELTGNRVFFPVGLEARVPLGERATFQWGAHVAPGYQRIELTGRQMTTCLLPACAPSETSLTFDVDENDSSFSVGAGVMAGIGFKLTDKLGLQFRSLYDYDADRGVADNRQNPADAETRMATDGVGSWSADFGLILEY
jgi:hypothetical protein